MQSMFFFVPIFFISIGTLIDPRAFLASVIPGLVITLLAILGKVIRCGGVLLMTQYSVGLEMIP